MQERWVNMAGIYNSSSATGSRLCDIASSHTMRRTAITTMLSLGVPEQIVRKVSGHAPASKEFYRYVVWSQVFQDKATERGFEKLQAHYQNELN